MAKEKGIIQKSFKPVTVTVIGLAVAALISYGAWKNHQSFVANHMILVDREMLNTAKTTAKSLQSYISEHLNSLKVLANIPEVQEQAYKKIKRCKADTGYCVFDNLFEMHSDNVDALYLIDNNGVILDRDPFEKGKIGLSLRGAPGVDYVLENHESYVSELFYNKQNKHSISISAPVFYNNDFVGMVRWMTRISTIGEQFIQPVKIGKEGFAVLLDDKGIIYHHPDKELIGKNLKELRKQGLEGNEEKESETIDNILSGSEGIVHFVWDEFSPEISCFAWTYISPITKASGVAGIKLKYDKNKPHYILEKKARVLALELDKKIPRLETLIDTDHLKNLLKAYREEHPEIVEITIHGPRSAKDNTLVYKVSTSPGLENKLSDSEDRQAVKEGRYNIQFVKQKQGRPYAGIDIIDVCVPIHTSQELWPVVVTRPHSEIMGPINRHARNMFGLAGLLLLSFGAGVTALYKTQRKKVILQAEAENLRKIAETSEALKESENRYRGIVENINDALYVHDFEGRLIDANKIACEALKYKREELIGSHLSKIDSEKDAKLIKDRMAKLIKNGSIVFEGEHVRKDGSYFPVSVSVKVISKEGKGLVQAFVRDITERKKTEEEIYKLNKKLKADIKEKTILLREIDHRVKNNFQFLSSLLNLQKRSLKDEKTKEELSEIQNRVNSMSMAYDHLKKSKSLSEVNVNIYINELIHNLVSYRKGIICQVNIDKEFSFEVGTILYVGLIVNEIVTNSLKYAFPEEKGKIYTSIKPYKDGIEILIGDNGIGLPEDIDPKKTESFGLKLVKLLSENQLDGELDVDSSNKGTEYKITFNPELYKK